MTSLLFLTKFIKVLKFGQCALHSFSYFLIHCWHAPLIWALTQVYNIEISTMENEMISNYNLQIDTADLQR